MFTIKYRAWNAVEVAGQTAPSYVENEQVWGPFEFVSKESTPDGLPVVYCHYSGSHQSLPMTFGAIPYPELEQQKNFHPRPTLWVMNENGATISKYEL